MPRNNINGVLVISGTATERAALAANLAGKGTEFWETVTKNRFRSNGAEWIQLESAGAALVSDGIQGLVTTMLTNATAPGVAASMQLTGAGLKSKARYSATIGGNNAIAVTATVKIYGSDATMAAAVAGNKFVLGTLTLSGTGSGTNATPVHMDAVHIDTHYWTYIWMDVTAIAGAGANVITGGRGV